MCIKKTESIQPDATVYHYDELCEELKYALAALVENCENSLEGAIKSSHLSSGDYVKFTDYYQVVY